MVWFFMVLNTTFNNISVISWWSVLLVEETEVPREKQRPVVCYRQTLSHNGVHLAMNEQVVVNPTTIRSRPRQFSIR